MTLATASYVRHTIRTLVGESAEVDFRGLLWDEETIHHIRRHGVTIGDIFAVWLRGGEFALNRPGPDHTATHALVGWDNKDRALFIALFEDAEQAGFWWPVTAHESRVLRRMLLKGG